MAGITEESLRTHQAELQPSRERIPCLDWIRVFSCICVTVVHFNAAVSGWQAGVFVYPNSVLPNYWLGGRVYLGDIGASLFFMLSGAALAYTYRPGAAVFYRKKFWSIYPMFWTAYFAAAAADFLTYKGLNTGSPLLLLFTFLGVDGYLCNLGLIGFDFYKLGEWFLGCILLLYLIFPLVHRAFTKSSILTLGAALLLYALFVHKVHKTVFFLRIPEMLLGMLFIRYRLDKHPLRLLAVGAGAFAAAWALRDTVNALTLCICFCMLLAGVLTCASGLVRSGAVQGALRRVSAATYPVFLVHHWIVARLVVGFPLESLPKRSRYMLFLVYMVLTLFAAEALRRAGGCVTRALRKDTSKPKAWDRAVPDRTV